MPAVMEKRHNNRLKCLVPIDGQKGSVFESTRTTDIGPGGIGLVVRRPVRVSEQIALQIDLSPDGEPVLMMGEVRWVKPMGKSPYYRVGLQFKDVLASGSRSQWRKYCQRNSFSVKRGQKSE